MVNCEVLPHLFLLLDTNTNKMKLLSTFQWMLSGRIKKISIGIISGIAMLFILAMIFVDAAPQESPQTSTNEDAVFVKPSKQYTGEDTKINDGTVLVTRVIDGDTIEVEGGKRVRYIGIDTPETVDPRKTVQCFGVEASNRNKKLVDGKRVKLEKDVSETDKYGRLLRYVYADSVFVNLVLLQEGFAYSSTYPPDVKYQDQFIEAQRTAKEQKNGLWGSCPVTPPVAPTSPTPTPSFAPTPSAVCTIKGNISSTGEKIYHVEGCGSYTKTQIDEARGERWFCAESEALDAGWRKALNC
ncbi:MAG: thermonuclease family protein [Parcubacteria group bacterium]|nr:thermonuclease family protein [Parcubacteria group bacterium]